MKQYLLYIFLLAVITTSCNHSKKIMADHATPKQVVTVKTLAQEPGKYQDQFEKGIDFLASGTEPFWSLEIDFDNYMHFKSVAGPELNVPAVKGVKAMDAAVTRYAAETEKGMLIVQLAKQECINDMSGEKSPFTVTVDVKLNNETNYTSFKGCGQNLADYRLHDIWVLDSIDHQKVRSANYSKGLPRLGFNLAENSITGFTGCNEFSTSILVMGKKINIGRISTPLTNTCNGINEEDYLKNLSDKTLRYSISQLKLFLQTEDGFSMVYKKVD